MIPKNKPAQITTICSLILALGAAGYEIYGGVHEILNSYATKHDVVELQEYVEDVRRELSLNLLDIVIMAYEDKLTFVEINKNGSTEDTYKMDKKNIERRLVDLKERRRILRLEQSNNTLRIKS